MKENKPYGICVEIDEGTQSELDSQIEQLGTDPPEHCQLNVKNAKNLTYLKKKMAKNSH